MFGFSIEHPTNVAGMEAKMETYSIDSFSRREILEISAVLTGAAALCRAGAVARAAGQPRTPAQILGPFYPLKEPPQTADLTRVPGRSGRAAGQVLNVMGR